MAALDAAPDVSVAEDIDSDGRGTGEASEVPAEPSPAERRRIARTEARHARHEASEARRAAKAAAREQADDPVDAVKTPGEAEEPEPSRDVAAAEAKASRDEAKSQQAEARAEAKRVHDEAKAQAKREQAEAKAQAKRERAEAKAQAKRDKAVATSETQQRRVDTQATDQAIDDDGIVEPPRAPRRSFLSRKGDGDGRSTSGSSRRNAIAVVIGAAGLLASIILAVGAMFVALGAESGAVFDALSTVCNFLVGPLRDVFSFSGENSDSKEALVAWGLGSMGYLVIGLVAQSFVRSDDD